MWYLEPLFSFWFRFGYKPWSKREGPTPSPITYPYEKSWKILFIQTLTTSISEWLVFLFFVFLNYYLFIFGCVGSVSVRGLSPVEASGGHSSSRCAGVSLSWPLLLWSTGSRRAGSVVVAHGPSCSTACGIFLDQGSNPCPLHWQADSQPLRHQGSPEWLVFRWLVSLVAICISIFLRIVPCHVVF